MSTRLHPTQDAIARIQGLGEKTIVEFFDEVSMGRMEGLVRYLPSVPGFRKRSATGIQRQKSALAKLLSNSRAANAGPREKQYFALYVIWRTWASQNLGDPKGINALIDQIEEAEVPTNRKEDTGAKAQNELIEKCFAALREWSLENKCSKEQIERLFTFSPFSETPEIRRLLDGSKTSTDVKRDIASKGLPQRLQADEEEIKSLNSRLQNMDERIDAFSTLIRDLRKEISEGQAKAKEVTARQSDILDTLDGQARAIGSMRDAIGNVAQDLTKAIKQADERFAQLSQSLTSASETMRAQPCGSHDEALADVEGRLLKLESGEQPRSRPSELPDQNDANGQAKINVSVKQVQCLSVEALSAGSTEFTDLTAVEQVVSALAQNLQRLGLKKSACDVLAEELCAAAFVGQLILLKGALSTEVARVCALTLAGKSCFRISIPIGLNDGEVLRTTLYEKTRANDDCVVAVVIEGINRSALDVFKDVISDHLNILTSRAKHGPNLLFASVVQGVASLPLEPNYLDLGPIFDLDYLDWSYRRPKESEPRLSTISAALCIEIRSRCEEFKCDNEEPIRLLKRFSKRRSPKTEATAIAAFRALTCLRKTNGAPTPLQSLAFGWLAPLWIALRLAKEEVDSELDGGKCDGEVGDPRLAAILAGGELQSRKSLEEG